MISTCKAVGLTLLWLGLAGRTAMAQITDCLDLLSAVEEASTTATTISLGADLDCPQTVSIASDQDITINGGSHSITIGTLFSAGTTDSIIANEGTLTINGVTFLEDAASELPNGVRAIHNTGTLTVSSCVFQQLNVDSTVPLEEGGAIFSASAEAVKITSSNFYSNYADSMGGAIFASGEGSLNIVSSDFKRNEASGSGGDVYAISGLSLEVTTSNFTDSTAEYGGAAIECCGGIITDCLFTGTESSLATSHYGAVMVGRPEGDACPASFTMKNSNFTGCTVVPATGSGSSLAVFNTQADIDGCTFESSTGTAVLFESSDGAGGHEFFVKSCLFNLNVDPSALFDSSDGTGQGAAVVVQNTGLADGDEPVSMGEFFNVFCYGNEPYQCEFVYNLGQITHDGEFKCRICDLEGTQQDSGIEDDAVGGSTRGVDSGSDSSNQGIVIGLSLALGLTLVVIGALAVWKFKVRKNARRLMEDMGDGDL